MKIQSKFGDQAESIFASIGALARKHDSINLGQGFPSFDCADELKNLVSKYLNQGKNQYAPMPGVPELREAISQKLSLSYGSAFGAGSEITITTGATEALFASISALVHAGDEVIIFEPAYDSYRPVIELQGGRVVSIPLEAPDFNIDWNLVESKTTSRTRMMVINTPHNPTGRVWTFEDVQNLSQIVAGTDIVILSDEVYEHIIFDDLIHHSILAYPELYDRCIAVFSFGKTFHSTGWKMGYAVAPIHLSREIRQIHQWNVFSVNTFIQYALAEYLQDARTYQRLGAFFQEKRDMLQSLLADTPLQALPCKGTYFQLYDYSEVSQENDMSFAKRLISDYGVATIPLSPFYSEAPDQYLIRLCFAKDIDILERGAARLMQLM